MRDLISNLHIYTTSETVLLACISIFPLLPFLNYLCAVLHFSIHTEM